MPFYVINGMRMHIRFSGRSAPAPCAARVGLGDKERACQDISEALCDWPLSEGNTCDMPLCRAHSHQVGRNRHYCPKHRAEQIALQPELGLFTSLIAEDTES